MRAWLGVGGGVGLWLGLGLGLGLGPGLGLGLSEANHARRATKKLVAKHMGVSRHSLRCGTHRCTHA